MVGQLGRLPGPRAGDRAVQGSAAGLRAYSADSRGIRLLRRGAAPVGLPPTPAAPSRPCRAPGRSAPRPGWRRVAAPGLVFLLVVAGFVPAPLSAEAAVSGRLDLGAALVLPGPEASPTPEPLLGSTAGGRLTVGGGSPAVKPEVRVGFNASREAAFSLDRAWVRFRLPGFRGALGLGRVAWGPALVLNPADLLFDSTSLEVLLSGDEYRSAGRWLADAWFSLGPESFLEALAVVPDPVWAGAAGARVALPGPASNLAAGLRLNLATDGIGGELAAAWDGARRSLKASLATQFRLGIDWQASLRGEWGCDDTKPVADADKLMAGFGGFALFDLGSGFSLATRHELLFRPLLGTEGVGPNGERLLSSYHDLVLGLPESFGLSLRALLSPLEPRATLQAELAWSGLPGLRLSLGAAKPLRANADAARPDWLSLYLGAAASW